MDELSNIVSAMMPELEKKINSAPSVFNLWFGDFNLAFLSESTAIFTTPSPLRKSILNSKYFSAIKDTLEEVIGFPLKVLICTADEKDKLLNEIKIHEEKVLKERMEKAKAQREKDNEQNRDENGNTKEESYKGIDFFVTDLDGNPMPKEVDDGKPLIEERTGIDFFISETGEYDLPEEHKEEILTEIINGPNDKKTLLDEYTFENFVEGSSNKFARAACMAVAKEPNTYNPLFIYGHSGLGKTHLLYAVINYMKKNHPQLKIVYKKCESFLDELIKAIRNGSTAPFKEKYRSADVLLIDDIQFLAGKEQTQEEFFHTFSALYESEKQIILTSDRPPKDIKPLEDRLRTRFEGGLLADVQPPSFELRIAIIKKKADAMGLSISNDLIEYMAERLQNNIRQIEGVLKRIYAIYSLTSAEVTKDKIDEVISIIDPGNIPTDTVIERILSAVSRTYNVSVDVIKSKKKQDNIANARHVAIYIIKQLTELTLKEIGEIFSRDHSTVISSIDKVERNMKTINNYENEINRIIKEVKG